MVALNNARLQRKLVNGIIKKRFDNKPQGMIDEVTEMAREASPQFVEQYLKAKAKEAALTAYIETMQGVAYSMFYKSMVITGTERQLYWTYNELDRKDFSKAICKENHPDVYAACQVNTPRIPIRKRDVDAVLAETVRTLETEAA